MASIGIRGGPRFNQFLGEVKLAVGGPRGVVVERTRAVVGVGVLLTEGGRRQKICILTVGCGYACLSHSNGAPLSELPFLLMPDDDLGNDLELLRSRIGESEFNLE